VPFRHPDRSHDLGTRIEAEVRERIEEAVDHVCLDALVRARHARGLPPLDAGSPEDRHAYGLAVLAFLDLLRRELTVGLDAEQLRRVAGLARGAADEQGRLIALQVALARMLPDYWQRLELLSGRYLADPAFRGDDAASDAGSGRQGGGLLARLFGRR
jgi:hypothetical protein